MTEKNFTNYFADWISAQAFPPGKQKALLAASELFSQQGYDATSTAQIAKKAGISEATILIPSRINSRPLIIPFKHYMVTCFLRI